MKLLKAKNLNSLLNKYKPETKQEKKDRLKALAIKELNKKKGDPVEHTTKPCFTKFGLRHVTTLIERRKAKLVIIAADVEPLEMVLFLPTLCRKMDIPYCIVKSKSHLGSFVHMKTAACLAITDVRKGKDEIALQSLVKSVREVYNDTKFKKWGGGEMGFKSKARAKKATVGLSTHTV